MSSYQRTTRACSIRQLKPELQRGIQAYFQSHKLGDPETETLFCCETITKKMSGGWLPDWLIAGPDALVQTGIVLTGRALVWARLGEQTGLHVAGAELAYIQTRAKVSMFTQDFGLEIVGLIDGSKGNVRGTIGLGPEEDAQKFCEEVRQAIEKVNPTPVRKWPTWMGGR